MPEIGVGDSGNASINELIQYLSYNSSTGRVTSSKPIETTIHSLYFGGVHSMSSIATNVVWKNLTTGIIYAAPGNSVGDHSQPGGEWVNNTTTQREYGDYAIVQIQGDIHASSIVDYDTSGTLGLSLSAWGHAYMLGEDYTGTVTYTLTIDGQDVAVREYVISGVSGGIISQVFPHQIDMYQGQTYTATLHKQDGSLLKVYAGANGTDVWTQIPYRTFIDVALVVRPELVGLEHLLALDTAAFGAGTLMYEARGFLLWDTLGTGEADTIEWNL